MLSMLQSVSGIQWAHNQPQVPSLPQKAVGIVRGLGLAGEKEGARPGLELDSGCP